MALMWYWAWYGAGPLDGCDLGLMLWPYMLGIVPPVAGVLAIPAHFLMLLLGRQGLKNWFIKTCLALLLQLPLLLLVAISVTPLETGSMWSCAFGA